jgi:hypothetical protein
MFAPYRGAQKGQRLASVKSARSPCAGMVYANKTMLLKNSCLRVSRKGVVCLLVESNRLPPVDWRGPL